MRIITLLALIALVGSCTKTSPEHKDYGNFYIKFNENNKEYIYSGDVHYTLGSFMFGSGNGNDGIKMYQLEILATDTTTLNGDKRFFQTSLESPAGSISGEFSDPYSVSPAFYNDNNYLSWYMSGHDPFNFKILKIDSNYCIEGTFTGYYSNFADTSIHIQVTNGEFRIPYGGLDPLDSFPWQIR